MASTDEIFAALELAARENHRDEFDRHEAELLARYGGFQGMPREIYDRYLEVDRAWPTALSSTNDDPSGHVTKLPLHTRLSDDLIAWLQELGAETGRNRSDVIAACLETIRRDEGLREAVTKALLDRTPENDDR